MTEETHKRGTEILKQLSQLKTRLASIQEAKRYIGLKERTPILLNFGYNYSRSDYGYEIDSDIALNMINQQIAFIEGTIVHLETEFSLL